jgi:hypothetical protein
MNALVNLIMSGSAAVKAILNLLIGIHLFWGYLIGFECSVVAALALTAISLKIFDASGANRIMYSILTQLRKRSKYRPIKNITNINLRRAA